MQFRHVGPSDLRVSLVGLGCNNFGGRIDRAASAAVIARALDRGITLFDTADAYGENGGSESVLGEFLAPRRNEVVIATKFGLPVGGKGGGASRRYIMAAVEASLRRLRTDWIDLYQLHRPDPGTPIEETLRALDDLVRQGKVRHIGCSNLSAKQLDDAQATAKAHNLAAFISCQDEYSLIERDLERDLLPAIGRHGLGLLPYFPLAGGLLSGKYRRGEPPPPGTRLARLPHHSSRFLNERNLSRVGRFEAFAADRGHSILELAFSWLASRPQIASVIAGATRPEQVDQNVAAVNWQLGAPELAEIDRLSR